MRFFSFLYHPINTPFPNLPQLLSYNLAHFPFSWTVASALANWILTFPSRCDSQGPRVSGGTTWAQALDDEDGAYYDAHEAHGQAQGTDHGLRHFWHWGRNVRFCESKAEVRRWAAFMCTVWGGTQEVGSADPRPGLREKSEAFH